MTHQELLDLQDALETALLTGSSTLQVQIGDRSVRYNTLEDINKALALVNRSLCRYNRSTSGAKYPGITTPRFTHYG